MATVPATWEEMVQQRTGGQQQQVSAGDVQRIQNMLAQQQQNSMPSGNQGGGGYMTTPLMQMGMNTFYNYPSMLQGSMNQIGQATQQNALMNLLNNMQMMGLATGGGGMGGMGGMAGNPMLGYQTQYDIAQLNNQAAVDAARLNSGAYRHSADQQRAGQQYAADAGRDANIYSALYGAQANMYGSDAARDASMFGAQAARDAQMYAGLPAAQANMYNAALQSQLAYDLDANRGARLSDVLNWFGGGGASGGMQTQAAPQFTGFTTAGGGPSARINYTPAPPPVQTQNTASEQARSTANADGPAVFNMAGGGGNGQQAYPVANMGPRNIGTPVPGTNLFMTPSGGLRDFLGMPKAVSEGYTPPRTRDQVLAQSGANGGMAATMGPESLQYQQQLMQQLGVPPGQTVMQWAQNTGQDKNQIAGVIQGQQQQAPGQAAQRQQPALNYAMGSQPRLAPGAFIPPGAYSSPRQMPGGARLRTA